MKRYSWRQQLTRKRLAGALALGTPVIGGCSPPVDPCPVTYKTYSGVLGYTIDGGLDEGTCTTACVSPYASHCYLVDAGLIYCKETCPGGRAPPGGVVLSSGGNSVGAWLARMAEFEVAAVAAFEHLGAELTAHDLPRFASAAYQAAIDEVRHADILGRIAARLGHAPVFRPIQAAPVRSLAEMAVDNGAEGCGRELLGARINFHQASMAVDPTVRRAMEIIAPDEASHGQFSLELASALMPRLTLAERRQVRETREVMLRAMVHQDVSDGAGQALGMPDSDQLSAAATDLLNRHPI